MDLVKNNRIFIGALCVSYVALRLWRLTDACLWFDEIFSIHAAEHSWGSISWFVAQDLIHPPLFYALLKIWIGIGGESLPWLRLFSVVFSAAALIPFICLCKELKLKASTTLLALAFFVVNGSLIKYAQEARMYSLLLCLSLFSLWLFTRFFFRGKNIWILTAVNALIVYSHYFGWFIVLAEIMAILVLQRIKIRHVLIMLAINIAAFVPWIFAIFKAVNSGSEVSQNIGWISRPDVRSIFDFAFDLIEPFYYQTSSVESSTILYVTLPLLAIVIAAKLIYLVDWKQQDEHDRFWLLGIISVVPFVIAFAISWVSPFSVWGSRHLIIVFAPMMILSAIFLTEIANRTIRSGLIAAVILLFAVGAFQYSKAESTPQIWCAWEHLAHELPADRSQTVYVFEDLVAYHFWFATRSSENIKVFKVDGVPEMVEDKAYFLPRGFDEVQRIDPAGMRGDRFWVAFRDLKWNEKHPPIAGILYAGYKLENKFELSSDGSKAFLVEADR